MDNDNEKEKLNTNTAPANRGPRPGGGHGVMHGVVEKPKNFKKTMAKLVYYLKPYRLSIIVVVIFAIASTIFAIVSPKILGQATNQIVNDYVRVTAYNTVQSKLPKGVKLPAGTTGADLIKLMPKAELDKISSDTLNTIKSTDMTKEPTYNMQAVLNIVLWLVILYVLSALFNYIQSWIMTNVTQKVTYRFRQDISKKINKLPLKYFDSRTYGEVLSRVTNDVDTVGQTLNQSLSQIVTSVVTLAGIVVMMLTISWLLTLVTIIVLPISFIIISLIMKYSQKQFLAQQESLGDINGHVEEMYSGHLVMRVFNGEKESIKTFDGINKKLYVSAWKAQFLSGVMYPLMNFVGNLGYVGVAVVGGWMAVNGKLQVGDIQAFIQYVQQFDQPITQTANIMNVLQSTAAAAERVFEFLDEEEESPDPENAIELSDVKGNVEFKNIAFSYKPEKPIIKDLSLRANEGQRIAIVGPTGAGKTTLVNLLMRFYDVSGGSILIDGVDTRTMRRADVRKLFGMVLQDTWLFKGTIRENLLYGNDSATEDEMLSAAKDAHINHFIESLPNGYDMELNEEASNISQGEKQLLTVARAMIAKTPILILDEATSSVDTRTEVLIQKAMENLMKDRTSFVIAHRLSTIKNADLILMMQNGDIVEQGTHDELLAKNGAYAEMYNSQFINGDTEEIA
jgi:ATP-binding cassette subfamily B protein